jgi:hypothetical protein
MRNITQTLTIDINGTNQSNKIISGTLSKRINRAYDVMNVVLSYKPNIKDSIYANIGNYPFTGFVHKVTQNNKDSYNVECRSNIARLTEPFVSANTVTENATTSTELWDLYHSKYGILIQSSETDLNFGANFKREGTPIQAIESICNVTKSMFYERNSTLIIEPFTNVPYEGTMFFDDEIYDFISLNDEVSNNVVSKVIINDTATKSSTSARVDEEILDDKTIILYPSNNKILRETKHLLPNFTGYNYYPVLKYSSVLKTSFIELKTAVKSIEYVKVDGIAHKYNNDSGSNIIDFEEEVRGVIEVAYVGYAFKTSLQTYSVDDKRAYQYDVKIGDAWDYRQGLLNSSCCVKLSDNMIIIPNILNYELGFEIYSVAPFNYEYRLNGKLTALNTVESRFLYTVTQNMQIEEGGTLHFNYPISEVVGVKHQGNIISSTLGTDTNGNAVITVAGNASDYVDGLEVTYTFNSYKYAISSPHQNGDVTMKISNGTDSSILNLKGINWDDINDIPHKYPARIPIDIASELNLPIHKVRGQTVDIVASDGTITESIIVNKFGYVYATIPAQGKYDVIVTSILPLAKMTINAQCQGV